MLALAPVSLSFSVPRCLSRSKVSSSSTTTSTTTSTARFSVASSPEPTSASTAASMKRDEEKNAEFLANCKTLCQERNFPFQKVKNARDLASVQNSPIQPGRVLRMGRVSDATSDDINLLMEKLQLKTLVDLRSPTELKDDPTLMRPEVFGEFRNVLWKEQGRGNDGCLKVLKEDEFPVKKHFWSRDQKKGASHHDDIDVVVKIDELDDELINTSKDGQDAESIIKSADDVVSKLEEGEDELCGLDCEEEDDSAITQYTGQGKERHFVSLMNEFKYVKGTVSKLRKRDITKAILKSPGALVSKRVRSSVKKPFLDEINDGGLPMLNELLLRFGNPGIKYVLELCSDRNRHPITFYCTAGKDRTGMITAILLGLTGVSVDDIVEDYTLSANVYAEMNDHKAMVGALSQRNLNAATFLGAPPQVMREIMHEINEHYGSVEGYCNWIGFGPEKQEKLRRALMDP